MSDNSAPRIPSSSFSFNRVNSRFISRTDPLTIRAVGGSNCSRVAARVDFPAPDSPSSPTTSPREISKLTSRTARTGEPLPSYCTLKLRTCNIGSMGRCLARRSDWSRQPITTVILEMPNPQHGFIQRGNAANESIRKVELSISTLFLPGRYFSSSKITFYE